MGMSDEIRKLNPDITEFIVSYDAYSDNATSVIDIYLCGDDSTNLTSSTPVLRYTTTAWKRHSSVIALNSDYTISDIARLCIRIYASENDSIYLKNIKVETGNKPTDWTPAPEDMATSENVNNAISAVEDKTNNNQSLIEELTSAISTLVVDSNGESLMVNDGSGWTFSTAKIQNMIDTASDNLDALTNEVGDVSSTVGVLQQAVDDLGILSDYVKITTYEDEPCIELGETDSDFKLLITNTRILFMEGSSTPAYVTNQSLHIKKAVIEKELQQGDFVWKIRSNGNMGLAWKGASS